MAELNFKRAPPPPPPRGQVPREAVKAKTEWGEGGGWCYRVPCGCVPGRPAMLSSRASVLVFVVFRQPTKKGYWSWLLTTMKAVHGAQQILPNQEVWTRSQTGEQHAQMQGPNTIPLNRTCPAVHLGDKETNAQSQPMKHHTSKHLSAEVMGQ